MRHIEQHILELFVLGSDRVMEHRAEIEAHLAECHGCRTLAEQMEGSYRDAEARFRGLQERPGAVGQAMERLRQKPALRYASAAAPERNYRPVTRFQRMQYLVRRHPVIVGSGTFGILAVLALLFNPFKHSHAPADTNPVGSHLNPLENTLEVLNRYHEVLWRLPIGEDVLKGAHIAQAERRVEQTIVADLDGDGVNEIMTGLRPSGVPEGDNVLLRVFRASGSEFFTVSWTEPITYLSVPYQSSFHVSALLAGNFGTHGATEILLLCDNGRSPNALVRVSTRGEILGSYWHHGALLGLYAMDLEGDGKTEIILTGRNDANEMKQESFPEVVVLDPARLVGNIRSITSPGYPFPLGSCELYCIQFPLSDMNSLVPRSFGHILSMEYNPLLDSLHLRFWFRSTTPTGYPMFEYLLTRDLRVAMVKSADQTDAYREPLIAAGKVIGKIGRPYLEDLRRKVRYFDGTIWVRDVVLTLPPQTGPSHILGRTDQKEGEAHGWKEEAQRRGDHQQAA